MSRAHTIQVPAACLPQILAQRTGCKKVADHAEAWIKSIEADWAQVNDFLPKQIDNSLDIGCGLAGFDVLLWRRFRGFMYLLDRDAFEKKPAYGFGESPSAYCQFDQVEEMMRANGVPTLSFETILSVREVIPPVELVTSFIAWGFHFPVDVYLADVARILRPGGRLIIDLRNEHADLSVEMIRNHIGPRLKEMPAEKHLRCVFEKAIRP